MSQVLPKHEMNGHSFGDENVIDKPLSSHQPTNTSIDEERKGLPIFGIRNKIIECVKKHDSVILIGETACGKTTQIPQFLYEANFVPKNSLHQAIGITQPRKVAAISIANRVAAEMKCKIGGAVGYAVRFEDVTCPNTKLKYMTDGTLLREAISDAILSKYKIIILDEAHERTVQTDILFGVVKAAQEARKQQNMPILKVIIMSATMDVDHFSTYFNHAPVYYLTGRQHAIKMFYSCKKQTDYVHSALATVFQIHQNEPEGDILVFCTGQEEIESMVRTVKESIPQLPQEFQKLTALSLYSALPSHIQLNVFKPLSQGKRKVIFATNIAETSITIPNIKYVIDTGMVKSKTFNNKTGFEMLKVARVSQAQSCQRSGRAGRESSGICYRLFTKEEYDGFNKFTTPDIKNCNLSNVVLQMIAMGINDVINFDFMDKPDEENIKLSLEQLKQLSAIEEKKENVYSLTDLGKKMVLFPVDPCLSKMIITSQTLGCTEEMITIISLLSVDNIFFVPVNQKETANEALKKFASSEGDFMKLLNVYKAYKAAKENTEWCKKNFIHINNMRIATQVRKQLMDICLKVGMNRCSCASETHIVSKCLATGLFMNAAILQRDGSYKTAITKKEAFIHPSSCLFHCKPEYIIYNELIETTKCYMRTLSVVTQEMISQ